MPDLLSTDLNLAPHEAWFAWELGSTTNAYLRRALEKLIKDKCSNTSASLSPPTIETALAMLPYLRKYDSRWEEVGEHNFKPDVYTAHRDLYDTVRSTL